MAVPAPALAVQTLLKADANVAAQVGTRVYWPELPRAETASMPRKVVLLQYAGGPGDASLLPVGKRRIDVRSYGAIFEEAEEVQLAVQEALKRTTRQIRANTLIENITPEGGPIQLREPALPEPWPLMLQSFIVTVAERAAA